MVGYVLFQEVALVFNLLSGLQRVAYILLNSPALAGDGDDQPGFINGNRRRRSGGTPVFYSPGLTGAHECPLFNKFRQSSSHRSVNGGLAAQTPFQCLVDISAAESVLCSVDEINDDI